MTPREQLQKLRRQSLSVLAAERHHLERMIRGHLPDDSCDLPKLMTALAAFAMAEINSETLDLHGDEELDQPDIAASREAFEAAAKNFVAAMRIANPGAAGFTHFTEIGDCILQSIHRQKPKDSTRFTVI